MGALDGKVALVTGAGTGLGRACALILARESARVIVVGHINREAAEETVRLIKDVGGDATTVFGDVSKSSDVQAMVRAAVDTYGGLDCAINNAALDVHAHPLAEISEEDWNRSIAVNLTGIFLCMKYEIMAMLERGGGAIVNVSSGGGLVGRKGVSWYTAAKHGILGLTKTAAIDYGARGIRINAICPGAMWTPLMRAAAEREPGHIEALRSMHPIGRIAEPKEVAEVAVWLCTKAASFVLGHALSVDGGWVIH
jgi:NAD(P)-dependent dehydrogenase (short-subunit alcohol dehydrogenase family)